MLHTDKYHFTHVRFLRRIFCIIHIWYHSGILNAIYSSFYQQICRYETSYIPTNLECFLIKKNLKVTLCMSYISNLWYW